MPKNNFKIKVNNSAEYEINETDCNQLDIVSLDNNTFHVLKGAKSYKATVNTSDFKNKTYQVMVNSNSYTISISNALDSLIKEMGFSIGNSKKANDIKAPMPGLILSVAVKEGQEVKEGETLLILEAMKMENAIGAPKDGVIKKVYISDGGNVEKGALLIEMEK